MLIKSKGGSGFIAAHIVDILLQRGYVEFRTDETLPGLIESIRLSFDTVFTVRSDDKGKRILENHPNTPKEKLSYVIVKDVAEDGAFDEVRG